MYYALLYQSCPFLHFVSVLRGYMDRGNSAFGLERLLLLTDCAILESVKPAEGSGDISELLDIR